MLRYAADLARLYAQAEQEREQLRGVEAGLVGLAGISLELARSLSLSDAGRRLARAGVDTLGLQTAAVYLRRKERFVLVARAPKEASFPEIPPIRVSDLAALGSDADELESPPWTTLSGGGRASVVPLLGRRQSVGFLAGTGPLPHLRAPDGPQGSLLTLLAGHAGAVLENHLLEERRSDTQATRALRARPEAPSGELLGRSPAMQEILSLVERLARVDSAVLLTGETGTGKTMIARLIHDSGKRATAPFVALNCAAIPPSLVESELFGHEAGAFTGALKKHRGKVEQAEGGTLFLDEIGELPLDVQSKLLGFLEDRRFSRVGGERELQANIRVVSATNRDLAEAVEEKTFRRDLLYRLNVFTIELPPLRRRGADVLLLAQDLGAAVASRYELDPPVFEGESERRLLSYGWPGNVRELRNVVEKAVILADGGSIPADLLPHDDLPVSAEPGPGSAPPAAAPAVDTSVAFSEAKAQMIERWEVAYIQALLRVTNGNIARASRVAQVDKKNLHRKIKKYGIDAQALRED